MTPTCAQCHRPVDDEAVLLVIGPTANVWLCDYGCLISWAEKKMWENQSKAG